MPDRHDAAHAVPVEALLWPGLRFACAPELVKKMKANAVSKPHASAHGGGTTMARIRKS